MISALEKSVTEGANIQEMPSKVEGDLNINEPTTNLTVSIKAGWNLLSFPVKAYLDKDRLQQFMDSNPSIEFIAKFDIAGWSYFGVDENKYSYLSRFSSLSSNEGFYIKASKDATITYPFYSNLEGSDDVATLFKGWNLIGFNKDLSINDVNNIYSNIVDIVWIFEDGVWKVYTNDTTLSNPNNIPIIDKIDKNLGVWIKTK
jgi:hypothetical protein